MYPKPWASLAPAILCVWFVVSGCPADTSTSRESNSAPVPDLEPSQVPLLGEIPTEVELAKDGRKVLDLTAAIEAVNQTTTDLALTVIGDQYVRAEVDVFVVSLQAQSGFEGFQTISLRLTRAKKQSAVADVRVRVGDAQVVHPEPEEPTPEEPEPSVVQPGMPAPEEPEVEEPEVGEPEVGEPEVGEPEVGEPEVIEPEVGEPQVHEPVPSEPGEPEMGEPEGGEPEMGEPEVGEPEMGEPDVQVPGDPEARDCRTHFVYDTRVHGGGFEALSVAGSFNGFQVGVDALTDEDRDGVWEGFVSLAPGDYAYKLVKNSGQADGDWIFDPATPYIKRDGCCDNSRVVVPDCEGPSIALIEVETDPLVGTLEARLQVWDSAEDAGVDWSSLSLQLNGEPIDASQFEIDGTQIHLLLTGLPVPDRYTLTGTLEDRVGARFDDLYVPIWLEEEPFSWADATLYFAFTDRFINADPSNDAVAPGVDPLANWHGGDFAGIRRAIEEGYFTDLGVNALWLSAPTDNPDEGNVGADGRMYASYHGYFPAAWRETENHFGSLEEMRALVRAAHRRGIRVLIDWVGNHVHNTHPWRTGARPDNWFNDYNLCRENDGWSQRPEMCWFEDYLPDLRYETPGVAEEIGAHGTWWVREANLDGFRVDAVKHMPHQFGQTLRAYIDPLFAHSNTSFYMVGETFTGTWSPATGDLLKAYLGAGELDGQFDFPVYWDLLRVIGRREGTFFDLDRTVQDSEGYYGPESVMSLFVGNHDVPRFVSHAWQPPFDLWGNGGRDIGWDPARRPGQPTEAEPYERLEQAFSFVMTMPGIPLIYYGDEVGLAGAGDPDNRRPFPEGEPLIEARQHLLQHVQALGQIRREHPVLRRGQRRTIQVEEGLYAYVRELDSSVSLVVLARDGGEITVALPTSFSEGDTLRSLLDNTVVTVSQGRISLALPRNGSAIFVREP